MQSPYKGAEMRRMGLAAFNPKAGVGEPTARLRLLQVIPSYYPAVRYGGPIRSVHALCAALVRRGHQVSVYTTNIDG
jgi:hypothetical protein